MENSIQRNLAGFGRRIQFHRRAAFRWPTAFRWRTDGGSAEIASLAALDRVIADLETLNHSTERDFLEVGGKLMEFRSAARRMASDLSAITELISGEHGRNASHALAKMLEHSKAMDARIEQRGQELGEVRDLSNQIRQAFRGLPNTVSVFRTLCTLTRIETSRLGGVAADLGDLAAEVGPLSESIQSSGGGVLEASHQLDRDVRSAIRSGAELRARQLQELPALIAGVIESLRSFEERKEQAALASARQAAQHASVCRAMDDVAGSIQFHDITRQQIEHVLEALRQLSSQWKGCRGKTGALPLGVRAIPALQSSQLSDAAGIFAASVERLQSDLGSIAAEIEEMADASRSLMGLSGGERDSFFARMEGQFAAILKILANCTTAQSELESTADSLQKAIASMRHSVAEIRATEIRIHRISINATIRATHLGVPGLALNVIAGVMQRLALDSSRITEEVSGLLVAMSEAAGRVPNGSGVESVTGQVATEMQQAVGELHASSESSFQLVNGIAALGARLAGDIGAVRNAFSAGRLFASVTRKACAHLQAIAAQFGPAPLDSSGTHRSRELETLASHYTMQRERDVHEAVARGLAIPPAASTYAPGAALKEGDLGANVDLF